ncbi:hypothetical protein K432DRAFT_174986 [Lepidopterella palustris CBS 459.81]|uniref:Uncharacterized protein n=1 Tax=Lepidopterella palustris CBS 459.81 TaxID=1314670 RepID=A0A8E2E0V3_9PEZI|nr:hypothetical protein K432DRAFT_174986 [Lepidopterella palustris CBS 459.81]
MNMDLDSKTRRKGAPSVRAGKADNSLCMMLDYFCLMGKSSANTPTASMPGYSNFPLCRAYILGLLPLASIYCNPRHSQRHADNDKLANAAVGNGPAHPSIALGLFAANWSVETIAEATLRRTTQRLSVRPASSLAHRLMTPAACLRTTCGFI